MKHVLGFSGGADSQAAAWWLRQRYPADEIILTNSTAGGNEHPITTEWIDWHLRNIHPVVVVKALIKDMGNKAVARRKELFQEDDELTFDRLAILKYRFPSSQAQFCTEHLKLAPMKRWCDENLVSKGIEFERYVGVRRDESRRRCTAPLREWDTYFDCWLNRPIANWSKALVFATLKKAGEKFNPLYTMGFGRVGCAPCINSNKEDVRLWAARFPEMIDKVREWEKTVGRTFFAPCVPGMEINWVDDVVAWSRTERGGKLSLPILEAEVSTGVCMSKYGLCE